jgi:hypothetical protein
LKVALLRILRQFHEVNELPGIVTQPGRYFLGAIHHAISHPVGEEFSPVCYPGRIDKLTLN